MERIGRKKHVQKFLNLSKKFERVQNFLDVFKIFWMGSNFLNGADGQGIRFKIYASEPTFNCNYQFKQD